MVIAVFLLMSSALSTRAIVEGRASLVNNRQAEVFYLAEGGTERAIAVFSAAIANYQTIPGTVTTTFPSFHNVTVNSTITDLESGNSTDRTTSAGGSFVKIRQYEITTTAVHPSDANITATVHQIIERRLIPTFQHAVFYNDDLEIIPGANMNLSGRIHCNEDMYLDAYAGSTLTINSTYIHSAGNIYNQRKDDGSEQGGEVSIRENKTGSPSYEDMDNLDCDNASWLSAADARWNGSVMSSVHGITKLTAPAVGSIAPGGYYASNANLVITANGSAVTVTKGGVPLTQGVDYPNGTFQVKTTFYDNRESQTVQMLEIDMRKLAGYNTTNATNATFSNNLPSNGLLYASIGGTGSNLPGVALTNATEIRRSGGLTVVSQNPVYLKGNYNTVNETSAAIICDSLNLVSNAWKDSNSTGNINGRVANATVYNSAFIAGVDETVAGSYNGGLENYPRLHEKWGSVNLTIKGSFVELWQTQVADGNWPGTGSVYTPPVRKWSYNENFNNVSNLPPFTPYAVEAERIAWWID